MYTVCVQVNVRDDNISRSEDFLCASVPEKKVKETCVEYLDSGSDLNKEVSCLTN